MTRAAALSRAHPPRFGVREAGPWADAATLVLVAHVAVAYAVQNFTQADAPDGGSPPALAIEMSPLVTAPAVQEEAPVPDTVMPDQAEAVEETVAEVKLATKPVPEPTAEEAEPAIEQPVGADEAEPTAASVAALISRPPLEQVVPDVVETLAPDVVVPLPQPKPTEAPVEPKVKKPVEAEARKPVDLPKPRPKREKPAPVNGKRRRQAGGAGGGTEVDGGGAMAQRQPC